MQIKCFASGSTGNFYTISGGKEVLMLETGISIKEIKKHMKFDFSNVVGCLISHSHSDHSRSIKEILKLSIDVYLSKSTKDVLKLPEHHRLFPVFPRQEFDIGLEWRVLFLKVEHDCEEKDPIGFLIFHKPSGKKILFATDTFYLRYKFNNLTHIMIEVNYSKEILEKNIESGLVDESVRSRLLQSHFEIHEVKKFFEANDCSKLEEVYLIHLSNQNSDTEQFKKIIQGVVKCPVKIGGVDD